MEQEIEKIAPSFKFEGMEPVTQKVIMPCKGIFYGDNGVGKSTLLSESKNPLIADMEGNCEHLKVNRFRITSALQLEKLLYTLLSQDHSYNTLGVDSLDSLETMISERINESGEDISWGKSKAVWEKHIMIFISLFERLYLEKNMNILFTAHVDVKTENNPMTEPYDRYILTINKHMKTVFCNWSQFVAFAMKEVLTDNKSSANFGKKKAKDTDRVILHTTGNAKYYAKNIFNLPEKIYLPQGESWSAFSENVKKYYNIGDNKNDV
jgi:AAA domain